MKLTEIKKINQDLYEIDNNILRDQKVVFLACLVFCSLNKDFSNPGKFSEVINFNNSENVMTDIVKLAVEEVKKINLLPKTFDAVCETLNLVAGVNTKLYKKPDELKTFVYDFVINKLPLISQNNFLFFETIYQEIDKKAKNNDKGITLTPYFAGSLMIDLAELNYKNDVIADLGCGTGLFSLLAYNKMLDDLEKDKSNITQEDYLFYKKRLFKAIIANDRDPKMVTLCLANFILKNLNTSLLFAEDVFELQKNDFKIIENQKEVEIVPTKGILNPPYEDIYKPVEIVRKTIELVKSNLSSNGEKVIAILPPSKFVKRKDEFAKILNLAKLDCVIKMQDDLFVESGQSPLTCIYVFDVTNSHSKNDKVRFYNFSDSGFVYLKDSGMVDKFSTYEKKKNALLKKIKNKSIDQTSFKRSWNNFYELSGETDLVDYIDPDLIKVDKEKADISFENITTKKSLKEKDVLIKHENDLFEDKTKEFENYLIDVLGEEY